MSTMWIISVPALLCTAFSTLVSSSFWQFSPWFITVCLFFVVLFLCRTVCNDNLGEITLIELLLTIVFQTLTFAVWNKKSEKAVYYRKKRNKKKKETTESVTEQPKRRPGKDKKKKRRRIVDEETESSPSAKPQTYNIGRTKHYQPLAQYTELNMNHSDLYYEFSDYILSPTQMTKLKFPIERLDKPGFVVCDAEDSRRICARCEKEYNLEGNYTTGSPCHYHKKTRKAANGIPGAGNYLCCDGHFMSQGCMTAPNHVSAQRFLQDVPFKKVPKKKQVRAGESHSIYALDTEMCYSFELGLVVTKIAVVNIEGMTILETFVLPDSPISDYNTEFSGVTANDLKGVKTTLADVQYHLLRLLNKDTILVGHGLENDLLALRLIHDTVVDTSVVFPRVLKNRYCKQSLKTLAKEYLNKSIQDGENGHDCVEDARTCMELMLWKINSDIKSGKCRPDQDENNNSYLQNFGHPASYVFSQCSQWYMDKRKREHVNKYVHMSHVRQQEIMQKHLSTAYLIFNTDSQFS